MQSPMKEITYSPLSQTETYKVILDQGILRVQSSLDEIVFFGLTTNNDQMTLTLNDIGTDNPTVFSLIALEYILGHHPTIKKIEITNLNQLHYPFNVLGTKFERHEFFQIPTLWHHRDSYLITPENWIETNGRAHPRRSLHHQGYYYRRYLPHLEKTVTFRLTNIEKDLDTFHEWHNSPRVSFFWELNQSKEELKAYMEKGLNDPHQIPMMVEMDGEPLGYYEMYWCPEDRLGPYYDYDPYDRGFHFLIGNKKFLGYNTTDSVIKSGLHLLFLDEARTRRIMAEPRHDNQKVLKYAEASIGWKKLKEFDFPHKRAALLENSREIFFGGDAL